MKSIRTGADQGRYEEVAMPCGQGKSMHLKREGFTTGSCATAAAKAAAYMLLSGRTIDHIDITVPRGDVFHAGIIDIMSTANSVRCAVRKDSGDDPDVTNGCAVYADVSMGTTGDTETGAGISENTKTCALSADDAKAGTGAPDDAKAGADGGAVIVIKAGEGIGRVTRPGLDRAVGEAAINSVPRQMIIQGVSEVCDIFDYRGSITVTISVPGGEELAKKTFNPRLGIEGGISIIGTSGVVEPMSIKALKDTIYLELRQKKELGERRVVITPGNYGRDFLKREYGYDIERAVKCSNYIGDTLDMCMELGFEGVLIAGHVGKMVKLAGGIMNTHSHEADARMEILAAAGIRAGLTRECLINILGSVSTTEALGYMDEKTRKNIMSIIIERISFYLDFKIQGCMTHECMIYCDEYALLGSSDGAISFLIEAGRTG